MMMMVGDETQDQNEEEEEDDNVLSDEWVREDLALCSVTMMGTHLIHWQHTRQVSN